MKVLLSWLRDFAPFAGDPVALGEEMSDLGMAVEELERIGEGLDGIVVARVLETRPIEGANKIHQVIVDAGDGEPLEIGCGAFNMAAGDLVPLATIGTVMPNGMEIGRRKMAGVWSNGMLCSTQELGLGDDHEGIYLLPAGLEPGTPFTEAMGIEPDVLYDLEINPNRPDAMSVAGVARDLAARLRLPFTLPDPKPATVPADRVSGGDRRDPRSRSLRALRGPRAARRARSVPATRSWRAGSRSSGMRSINNVVDVSNYVMLELGQPNHPYDLAKVAGPGFRVRVARDGETLTTLDDVERRLTAEDLLICDGDDVAGRHRRDHGRRRQRDRRRHHRRAARDGLVPPDRHREVVAAPQAPLRGQRPVREGLRPRGGRPGHAPLRRAARRAARGRRRRSRPARCPSATGARAHGSGRPSARHRALHRPHRRAARPDRVHHHAGRRRPRRRDPVVALRLRDRDRRHRGDRPPPRLHRARSHAPERRPRRVACHRARPSAAASDPSSSGAASPRPCRCRSSRPGSWRPAGCPTTASRSPTRWWPSSRCCAPRCCPGWSGAVAYNWSHRNHGVRLFEIGHTFNRPTSPDAELPDERECLGAVLAGSRSPRGGPPVAVRLRGAGRDRCRHRERRGARAPPDPRGADPRGRPSGSAPSARSTPACWTPTASASGSPTSSSISTRSSTSRTATARSAPSACSRAATSTSPSRSTRTCPPQPSRTPSAAPAASSSGASASSTSTEAPGVADGRRSLAYTLRLQAADRTLTDADVAAGRGSRSSTPSESAAPGHPAGLAVAPRADARMRGAASHHGSTRWMSPNSCQW